MRRWLVEIPARCVELWFAGYQLVLAIITIVTVSLILLMLGMALLGIRWGW